MKLVFVSRKKKRKSRKWAQEADVKKGALTELLGAEPSTLSAHTIATRVLRKLKTRYDRVAALRKLVYAANLQRNKNPLIAKKFYDAAHEIGRHLEHLERNPNYF